MAASFSVLMLLKAGIMILASSCFSSAVDADGSAEYFALIALANSLFNANIRPCIYIATE